MRATIGALLFGYMVIATAMEPRWYWDDAFSAQERAGLRNWIEHTLLGMTELLGQPLETLHVHFRHHRGGGEPVPWAETNKGGGPRVFFHVDTSHEWGEFKDDWTASHELSHLLFPYLGEDSRWFAEGIASYLQYQVMHANDVLSWDEAIERYRDRFRSARTESGLSTVSIVEQSRSATSAYVRLYWGGAAYFLHADRELWRSKGLRLTQVISDYVECCYRPWGVNATGMIRRFDRLSDSTVFADTYARTVTRPGFPETAEALSWLERHPPLPAAQGDRPG